MKIFKGVVTSVKMNKTAVVKITRRVPHPLYKKLIKTSKKYKVGIDEAKLTLGETVEIIETRPIAKDKHFKLLTVKEKQNGSA